MYTCLGRYQPKSPSETRGFFNTRDNINRKAKRLATRMCKPYRPAPVDDRFISVAKKNKGQAPLRAATLRL